MRIRTGTAVINCIAVDDGEARSLSEDLDGCGGTIHTRINSGQEAPIRRSLLKGDNPASSHY